MPPSAGKWGWNARHGVLWEIKVEDNVLGPVCVAGVRCGRYFNQGEWEWPNISGNAYWGETTYSTS